MVVRVVALGVTFSLAACSEGGGDVDAGRCDLDTCTTQCLGDGGGVAACVIDECFCFPLPRDGGEDEEGEADHD